jgi:hypothetical protein
MRIADPISGFGPGPYGTGGMHVRAETLARSDGPDLRGPAGPDPVAGSPAGRKAHRHG